MRSAWIGLFKRFQELNAYNTEETSLVNFVTQLVKQSDGQLDKIYGAVEAVDHLVRLFENQHDAYQQIIDYLVLLKDDSSEENALNRRDAVRDNLEDTIAKIEEVSLLSLEIGISR